MATQRQHVAQQNMPHFPIKIQRQNRFRTTQIPRKTISTHQRILHPESDRLVAPSIHPLRTPTGNRFRRGDWFGRFG